MSQLLDEALVRLTEAYQSLVVAAAMDDLTPLGNAIALRRAGTGVATGNSTLNVVVFGDLNRFKALNDQHGHEKGDAAIAYVGSMIDTLLVKSFDCQAFRRSGDEFVILTNEQGLEHLREKATYFKNCRFSVNRSAYSTSMSFGAAVADGAADFHQLLERAEVACQTAKSVGDGELVVWSSEIQAQSLKSLRGRCSVCKTKILCDVPAGAGASDATIVVCPICQSTQ